MQPDRTDFDEADLISLLQDSALLEPALKRHWLGLLPYLTPADRARLAQLLGGSASKDSRGRPSLMQGRR
jgi:hypothetical protein